MVRSLGVLVQQRPRINEDLNEIIEDQSLAYIHLHSRSSVIHVGHEIGISISLVHKI